MRLLHHAGRLALVSALLAHDGKSVQRSSSARETMALAHPEVRERILQIGFVPTDYGPDEYLEFLPSMLTLRQPSGGDGPSVVHAILGVRAPQVPCRRGVQGRMDHPETKLQPSWLTIG